MYKKFAELLITHNTENIYNGILLVDEVKRCNGDEFIELIALKQILLKAILPFKPSVMNSRLVNKEDTR